MTTQEALNFCADMVQTPYSALDMQETAKILGVSGMDRSRLYAFLRNEGILTTANHPYQEYINNGYFAVVVRNNPISYGLETRAKVLVYPSGLQFIHALLCERFGKKTIKTSSYRELKKKQEARKARETLSAAEKFKQEALASGVVFVGNDQ